MERDREDGERERKLRENEEMERGGEMERERDVLHVLFFLLSMLGPLWTETWTFIQHALRRLPNIDEQPPSQFKRWHICLQEVGR